MKVYLAGGMRSNWREHVKLRAPQHTYFTPGDAEKRKGWGLDEYAAWDFHHIRQCDVVFAYMSRTNPSGIGMSVEMGYAYALGKTVVHVLEDNHTAMEDRYIAFQKKAAHITFDDLNDGVDFLQELL